jgi:hypothetical protein
MVEVVCPQRPNMFARRKNLRLGIGGKVIVISPSNSLYENGRKLDCRMVEPRGKASLGECLAPLDRAYPAENNYGQAGVW